MVVSSDAAVVLNGCDIERIRQDVMALIIQFLRPREVFDLVLPLNKWFRVIAEMGTGSLLFELKSLRKQQTHSGLWAWISHRNMSLTSPYSQALNELQKFLPRFDFKHGRGCLQNISIHDYEEYEFHIVNNMIQTVQDIIPDRIIVSLLNVFNWFSNHISFDCLHHYYSP